MGHPISQTRHDRMKLFDFLGITSIGFAVLVGCTPKGREGAEQVGSGAIVESPKVYKSDTGSVTGGDWLDREHIRAVFRREARFMNTSDQAMSEQLRDLSALREQSSILLNLWDRDHIQILKSRIAQNPSPSNDKFPISELRNHLALNQPNKPIDLVVIIIPSLFPGDELPVVRQIDKVLRDAHVRRRVFEILDSGSYFKLDSASE